MNLFSCALYTLFGAAIMWVAFRLFLGRFVFDRMFHQMKRMLAADARHEECLEIVNIIVEQVFKLNHDQVDSRQALLDVLRFVQKRSEQHAEAVRRAHANLKREREVDSEI